MSRHLIGYACEATLLAYHDSVSFKVNKRLHDDEGKNNKFHLDTRRPVLCVKMHRSLSTQFTIMSRSLHNTRYSYDDWLTENQLYPLQSGAEKSTLLQLILLLYSRGNSQFFQQLLELK